MATPKRQRTNTVTSPIRTLANVFHSVEDLDARSTYRTRGGITVHRRVEATNGFDQLEQMTDMLDTRRGAIFKSSYEYPGRYNRWSLGFVNPPVEISCNARAFKIRSLNQRGAALLPLIYKQLNDSSFVDTLEIGDEVAEKRDWFKRKKIR